ncbi:MAG: hypothetical protein MMC33_005568 [Icmadophila ericetorum]|nr:hypothetical protein [Icmadophila ericetorum]
MSFLKSHTYNPDKDISDLAGIVFAVTGGSAGIGFGIVAYLVQHNASKILILSNKKQHAEEAMEELKEFGDTSHVHWVHCDLSDLKQTDQVAKELARNEKQLDALICNAGLGVGKYWETTDGLDSHFQVNHLSQFHLLLILLPNLQATPNSRLVLMSFELHRAATPNTNFASVEEINTDVEPSFLYNQSKLAQVLIVRALKRRMDEGKLGFGSSNKVFINATHPGAVSTDQPIQSEEAYGLKGTIGVAAIRPFMKDPVKKGCRSVLFVATVEKWSKMGLVASILCLVRRLRVQAIERRMWIYRKGFGG